MVSRLFGKLLGRDAEPERPHGRIPDGERIYAVGDIHGRLDLLQELHQLIAADRDAATAETTIVYLGDYVDRGMESRQVVDFFLSAPDDGLHRVFLLGNHEAMLLNFHQSTRGASAWLSNGGLETLHSYGIRPPRSSDGAPGLTAAHEAFREHLPEAHLVFFQRLRLSFQRGDYFFVHAGVHPGRPLEQQLKEDMIWIRDPFLEAREDFSKIVVHGHSIRMEVEERANRIGIDTGAYMSGKLTALVLEGEERRYLST